MRNHYFIFNQVVIGKVHKSGLPDLDNFKLLLPSSSKGTCTIKIHDYCLQ